MATWLVTVGLFIDIIGASWITAADLPSLGDYLTHLDRRAYHVQQATDRLLDESQKSNQLCHEDAGFEAISAMLERRLDRQITEDDVIESRGYGAAVGVLEGGERLTDPVIRRDFREWIDNWKAGLFRRTGLSILIVGFIIQGVGVYV